jgi:hypothetical protein
MAEGSPIRALSRCWAWCHGFGALRTRRPPRREIQRAIIIGGGPGAKLDRPEEDWLVTDERAELIAKIRRMAREQFGVRPRAGRALLDDLRI